MPRKTYTGKLSDEDVIRLIEAGRYVVDPDEGIVRNANGKELFTWSSGRSEGLWVRLYEAPNTRALPVAHMVWMNENPDEWLSLFIALGYVSAVGTVWLLLTGEVITSWIRHRRWNRESELQENTKKIARAMDEVLP